MAWRLLIVIDMRHPLSPREGSANPATRSYLVAVALGSLVIAPVASADEDDEYEGDGPEAEAVAVFDLDQMIEVAVRRSPDLARAKMDRSAAKGDAGAARADQQWVMQIGAQYKKNAVSAQVQVEPFSEVSTDAINAILGLGRSLPTGARLDVELGLGHVTKEIDIPDVFLNGGANAGSNMGTNGTAPAATGGPLQDKYTTIQTTARVTVKQPLVRGFGPDVALAAEKRADFNFSAETVKAQLAAEEMIREVVSQYWELAFASYEVDTRGEAVLLAEAQEKLTREELRAGKAPQNAVNAVVYEIAIRKEALLKSQVEAEKKSLDLRRKVGLGLGRREVLMKPAEQFEVGEAEWDVDEVLERSRKTNRKLATIALQKKIADVEVKVTKNATLPQVDVSLSGALIGGGNTTGESITGLTEATGYEIMAGLSVSFELSGAAKSRHEAAVSRRRRLDVDRADVERQIDAEVVNAVKTVTFARTRVMLSDKAIAVAEDNAKAERLNFLAGKTTNFSVMQRQTELVTARLARGRAVADYHIAVAMLQYLSGTLLEQYRVNVRPNRVAK